MTDIKGIKDLVVHSFFGTSPDPTKFSNKDVTDTATEEIRKLASTYRDFMRNKNDIFQIMEQAYTEILPKEVEAFIGTFAQVDRVRDNEKMVYVVKAGRNRGRQFVTQVGLSGAYEAFRLDKNTFELGGKALGGTTYVDYERMITGLEDINEQTQILYEGMQYAIYGEIQKALLTAVNATDRPQNNRYISAGFDGDAMYKLCMTASAYSGSGSVVIYATPEFVAEMGPDIIGYPVYGNVAQNITGGGYGGYASPLYNPRNVEEIANAGRIKTFRGFPIVEIPQSFTDETNTTTVANPSTAFIFPVGDTKPVKVVFEGDVRLDDFKGRDRTYEVEIYQKVGVAILTNYDWCVYVNMNLADPEKYPTKYQLDLSVTAATGTADGTYSG